LPGSHGDRCFAESVSFQYVFSSGSVEAVTAGGVPGRSASPLAALDGPDRRNNNSTSSRRFFPEESDVAVLSRYSWKIATKVRIKIEKWAPTFHRNLPILVENLTLQEITVSYCN
jgi:hypothetical protein